MNEKTVYPAETTQPKFIYPTKVKGRDRTYRICNQVLSEKLHRFVKLLRNSPKVFRPIVAKHILGLLKSMEPLRILQITSSGKHISTADWLRKGGVSGTIVEELALSLEFPRHYFPFCIELSPGEAVISCVDIAIIQDLADCSSLAEYDCPNPVILVKVYLRSLAPAHNSSQSSLLIDFDDATSYHACIDTDNESIIFYSVREQSRQPQYPDNIQNATGIIAPAGKICDECTK